MRGGTNSTSASTINITDNITVNGNYLTAREVNAVRTGNVVQVTIRDGTVNECRDGTVISGLPRALVHSTIPLVNVGGLCYGSIGIDANDNRITMYTGAIGQIWMAFTYLAKGGGIKALLGKARALLQEVLSHAGKYQLTAAGTDRLHTALLHENKRRCRVCGLSIGEVGIRCPAICRADHNYRLAHISGLLQDGTKRHCFYKCRSSNNLWYNSNSHKYLWNFRKYAGHSDISITVNTGAVA